MEQGSGGKNQNESYFSRNQVLAGIAVIAAIVIIVIAATRNGDNNDNSSNDQANQNQNQNNQNQNSGEQPPPPPAGEPAPTPNPTTTSGDVSAAGVLRTSDNAARGNLMVDTGKSKIYIATSRNFSNLVDKQVTLQAQGTINKFTFLGFKEGGSMGNVAGTDTDNTAKGGAEEEATRNVSFSGKLAKSDNSAKGNYVIVSGNVKVYLQTARDYSSLVGSEVTLTATGTIKSFANARVVKK
jgi:hypothetical protein